MWASMKPGSTRRPPRSTTLGAGTGEFGDLGGRPDGDDASAGDGDRLVTAPGGVDRVDLAARQDHVGRHRTSPCVCSKQ